FTLARFSEAFLILRAQNVGLSAMWVPAVLVLMNVIYALSAYPAGVLSDRINRKALLVIGLLFLAGADLALALMPHLGGIALGGTARYFVSGVVARRLGETFPWGTMIVNVTGAFLIGILGALASNGASLFASSNPWLFAVTGFLGCYTTVSSFSLQTLALARDGESGRAVGYVVLSVVLSLAAVAAGFAVVSVLR